MTMQKREFKGTYNPDLVYGDGDVVFCYNPLTRKSAFFESLLDDNKGNFPFDEDTPWLAHTVDPNIVISDTDAWNPSTLFAQGKLVTHDGAAFCALVPNVGQEPDIAGSPFWSVIATTVTTRHASTHLSGGRDPIPTATISANGLMSSAHVAALEEAVTDIATMQGAGTGSIPASTVVGNNTGTSAPSRAMTVGEVLALLSLTPVSGKAVASTIAGVGSISEIASTASVIAAIDDALSGAGSAIAQPVADLASLQALDTTDPELWPDKIICTVSGANSIFRLSRTSTLTANGTDIIQPTVGVGRWIKIQDSLTDHSLLSNLQGGGVGERYHLTLAQLNKLIAIPADAAAPLTGAEIVVLYEGEADRNAFTDAEKSKLANFTVSGPVNLTDITAAIAANSGAITTVDGELTAHVANHSNPHAVTASQLGLTGAWLALCNFGASAEPTLTNDSVQGYSARSLWSHGARVWMCLDATASNAVWVELSGVNSVTLNGQNAAYYLSRANHTGTQVAATISDFQAAVNTILSNTQVTALQGIANVGSGYVITSAERAKLAGIEVGATGDMTKLEIMTLYESNDDRNGFSDADKAKLDGINTSAYCTKAMYDPNARAADCFNSSNIDYDNSISGLGATKVKSALDALKALCDGLVASGSTGAIQWKNAQGKLSGFGVYNPTTNALTLTRTTLVGARVKQVNLGNWSGFPSIATPDEASIFKATVTGTTSFAISALALSAGELGTSDMGHIFTLVLVNNGAYAVTEAGSVSGWIGAVPDLAVAGTHVMTFMSYPGSDEWIGQYNGRLA